MLKSFFNSKPMSSFSLTSDAFYSACSKWRCIYYPSNPVHEMEYMKVWIPLLYLIITHSCTILEICLVYCFAAAGWMSVMQFVWLFRKYINNKHYYKETVFYLYKMLLISPCQYKNLLIVLVIHMILLRKQIDSWFYKVNFFLNPIFQLFEWPYECWPAHDGV